MNVSAEPDSRERVLVAVDFSDDSRAALKWACRYATATGSALIILHVVHDPAAEPGYYWEQNGKHLQPMQDVAARMLEDFVDALECDEDGRAVLASAEQKLLRGLPPGRIVELADLLGVELIVIGSRGMSGLPHIMQGSVSERVVELASRPVVVVKARGKLQREAEKARRKAEKKRLKEEKKANKKKDQRRTEAGEPLD